MLEKYLTLTGQNKKDMNRYETKLAEAKAIKIDLSIVSDLEDLAKLQNKFHKQALALNSKLESTGNAVQNTDKKYTKIKKQIDALKTELMNDWEKYKKVFNEAKDVESQGSNVWARADKTLGNYSRAAKELGVNPRDNSAYMKVWSMHNELAGEIDDLMMGTQSVVKVINI